MPHAPLYIGGFKLYNHPEIGGYRLDVITSGHDQIIRYHKYEYPSQAFFVPLSKSASPKELLREFTWYVSGSRIIDSEYGNPYECVYGKPEIYAIEEDGRVEIRATGTGIRIYDTRKGQPRVERRTIVIGAIPERKSKIVHIGTEAHRKEAKESETTEHKEAKKPVSPRASSKIKTLTFRKIPLKNTGTKPQSPIAEKPKSPAPQSADLGARSPRVVKNFHVVRTPPQIQHVSASASGAVSHVSPSTISSDSSITPTVSVKTPPRIPLKFKARSPRTPPKMAIGLSKSPPASPISNSRTMTQNNSSYKSPSAKIKIPTIHIRKPVVTTNKQAKT